MNFTDIREQLLERWQTIWAAIQDNATYISLKERYDNLSPSGQRSAIAGAVAFVVLLLLYIPYSYFDASSVALSEFESKRELTRALLRVTRTSNQRPLEVVTTSDLRMRIENELRTVPLPPEQIERIQEVAPDTMKALKLAPAPIVEDGLEVHLKKLNLKQMVDIGYRLQTLSDVVKLSALNVVANREDKHYYDVTYTLASFSVPQPPAPPPEKGPKGRGR